MKVQKVGGNMRKGFGTIINKNSPMTISEIDAILESMKEKTEPIHQSIGLNPYSHLMIKEITKEIDAATNHMKELFKDIGNGGKFSLEIIQENIVPTIRQAAEIPHLYHLFYELNEKDEYTYRHTICVGIIATMIGKWLNLPPKDLNDLTLGATLHDIGKAKISVEILHKPGKLTKEEYDEMKLHTIYGYELLKNIDSIHENVALIALQHHEREDGKGYPMGLAGHQVGYLSKIVAVADVFHAMSSARVYHQASPFYAVMKQMQNDAFGKLEPNIVLTFMNKIMNSLVGKRVLLTDQSEGIILMIDPYDPIRCLIQTDERLIDLRYSQNLQIEKVLEEI
ncbi:HD-GYP domain-containing protein [Robertmurraya sp. Marseille-Q9965]